MKSRNAHTFKQVNPNQAGSHLSADSHFIRHPRLQWPTNAVGVSSNLGRDTVPGLKAGLSAPRVPVVPSCHTQL